MVEEIDLLQVLKDTRSLAHEAYAQLAESLTSAQQRSLQLLLEEFDAMVSQCIQDPTCTPRAHAHLDTLCQALDNVLSKKTKDAQTHLQHLGALCAYNSAEGWSLCP